MFKIYFIIFLLSPFLHSGHPICIDGLFNDWGNVPVAYQDIDNDHVDADYSTLKITYDSEFLFIYINFHENEYLMQNWNDFHVYIDSDNDQSTGNLIRGVGADLIWSFGGRSGKQYINGQESTVYQKDLTLRIAPTVTSSEFEIAIARGSSPLTLNNQQIMTQGKIVFSELEDGTGDFIPDELGGVSFSIGEDFIIGPEPITIERLNESDLRVVSYNTLNEGILDSDRQDHFKRILQTIDPDIIALQEHSDWDEIHDIIQSWFPQEQWYASWTYRDLVILSRFQIIHDANIISSERTMAALLDTEDELGKNLLIFNSHLSCCDNDEGRQEQVDEFSSVWRNWVQNGNGPFELEYGTPFIHLGDFNYVGYNQQVETIKTGDIINENDFGVDFLPDWDSTAIIDLFSRQTHKRMGYTWRNDGSSFNPGKLDYIFYSDASIDTGKHYILNTLAIDQTDLDNYNLQLDDTQEASDHLPLVFDIIISSNVGVGDDDALPNSFRIYPNYPNPFNSTTKIDYQLPKKTNVQLVIFDILGRSVITLVDDILQPGYKTITWNGIDAFGNNVSAGMYFYMIQTGKNREVKKMVLLK
ncbi:T9SS type A sorting domain-containing protein [Candidatus Marinimicrobia bacterium]|nr:T9SS type A sorting domain-containing protein [Candidatus Neomarinimicrobiota bacterium]